MTRGARRRVMRPRRNRPLFIIDIAVPRDVEAGAGDLDQVFLYNIDDLQSIVNGEPGAARRRAERAEAIVNEEVTRFTAWMQSREIVPTVVALRAALRGDPAVGAAAAGAQDGRPAARGARPRRRDHASDRREAAAHADRAAEGGQRRDQAVAYADALNHLFSLSPDETTAAPPATAAARGSGVTRRSGSARAAARWRCGRRDGGAPWRARRPAEIVAIRTAAIDCRTRRSRKPAASGSSSRRSKTPCSRHDRRGGPQREGPAGRAARGAQMVASCRA